ncbi:amino acid ABC transporter ATP-binding protein [Candidatus Babeliales bacterium]|nr:amino acid ABC transporter ATP-binding protein [Candidatus Babeliales bacterium]
MLIVKQIFKNFYHKKIINDVSFNLSSGQIAVLLGRSGVGKSTMLRILCNLESFDSGSIQLNGTDIDFSKVGMVFQDFNLFPHLSVLQNITLPLMHVANKNEQDAIKIAQDMLRQFDMLPFASVHPASLSGGQKQRVSLARALCMNPKVLCLDEPTSALDPELTYQVAQIIKNLVEQGIMIVIATHDISFLQELPCTIYLMEQGKIIESATTQELHQDAQNGSRIKNFIRGIVHK